MLYKGQDKYTTLLGAIVSVMVVITMVAYVALQMQLFINRSDPDMNTLSFQRDLDDEPVFDPYETGFEFALSFYGPWIDPEYGTLTVTEFHQFSEVDEDGVDQRPLVSNELEMVDCGTENFNFEDKAQILAKGINWFKCTKQKSFEVQGNWFSSNFKYGEIRLSGCNSDIAEKYNVTCKTNEEIKAFMQD